MRKTLVLAAVMALGSMACGRSAIVGTDALPLKRVVIYRNGIGYFERAGRVQESEVHFKMREGEVGDFLATLAVIEKGGSAVKAAAFPLNDDQADAKPRKDMTDDEKKGLKKVVLSLDGKEHDLQVGYVAESPVWKPSYRVVVRENGQADLQVWGIVENLSGEDWKDVKLALVAGAPLAFEAQLGEPVIPERPVVTDSGEVIAAVPKAETSLSDQPPPPPSAQAAPAPPADESGYGYAFASEGGDGNADKAPMKKPSDALRGGGGGGGGRGGLGGASGPRVAANRPSPAPKSTSTPATEDFKRENPSQPRNIRSLAAIAQEGGTTRYDIPDTVTIPDRSATMVMLLARSVPGESIFLFAPDGGVPDSMAHPFRVARFSNVTGGTLERGPIAVFEQGAFLGQGMLDPLPAAATATVPFALERSVAIDQERKYDELGERVAKIENGQLTIERDAVTQTKYRIKNGGDAAAKTLVKHARQNGARLFQPPKDTEDNVGTGSALVPITVAPRATGELVVDERITSRRWEDWFSVVADNAVKNFLADARSDKAIVAKLGAAWSTRDQIVALRQARQKLAQEQMNISQQTEETRRNIRAIEKNKSADALRQKLTQRLGEMATRLDDITKQLVETDQKLAELDVRFKEGVRDITYDTPLPPKP